MKISFSKILLLVASICVFVAGCSGSPDETSTDPSNSSRSKPSIRRMTDKLLIPTQKDGESAAKTGIRSQMDADVKEFIKTRIFWMGNFSVLIPYVYKETTTAWNDEVNKPMTKQNLTKLKYIWLNPVGIYEEKWYPADIICISNANKKYYSSNDVNEITQRSTKVFMSEMLENKRFSTKWIQCLKPQDKALEKTPAITSTLSFVDGTRDLGRWNNNIGFLFEFHDMKDKYKTYKIWYTGPIDDNILPKNVQSRADLHTLQTRSIKLAGEKVHDARYMPDVDVIIVPIASPSEISPRKLDNLATYLNAKAIYFIGLDNMSSEKREKYIDLMINNAKTPLWIPELPTTKK